MGPTKRIPILLGESGASVVRCTPSAGSPWIEKSGQRVDIAREAEALRWCEEYLPVARLLDHRPGMLILSELPGSPLSESPADICSAVLASALAEIHAVPIGGCPLQAGWSLRIQEAETRLRAGLVDELDFDDANLGRSAESLFEELRSFPPLPERSCFTHGDATLENFLVHEGNLSGIVDMGRSGITHPAQDWALALRSMRHHFGTDGERQLRAYLPPDCTDASLLNRFLLLDEFF